MKTRYAAILTAVLMVLAVSAAASELDRGHANEATELYLRATANQVDVRIDPVSGAATFVRAKGAVDLLPGVAANKGQAFLRTQGAIFGIKDVDHDLAELSDTTDGLGHRIGTYRQVYKGVPVFGARLNTSVNRAGELTRVNGSLLQDVNLSVAPGLSAADARERAVAHILRSSAPRDIGTLSPSDGVLYIYNAGFIRHRAGLDQLVYEVEVKGKNLREFVYVDAHTGKIADQITGIYDIDRRIYEGGYGESFLVWEEGGTYPTQDVTWNNLIDFSEDTYNLAASITGGTYLSWRGDDNVMDAVSNDPAIDCPNAVFTGSNIAFCANTTTDDVVGHEWFHGYTQETHGLIYRDQSGALNEAYSDIFGEVIDFLNGAGTDNPGGFRAPMNCSIYNGGSPAPSLTVLNPLDVAGTYSVSGAAFNPTPASATGDVELAIPNDGCTAITNEVSGKIALIDRGSCDFVLKVANAEASGALGVIVANNVTGGTVIMGGTDPSITIPSVMISLGDRNALTGATGVVSATIDIGAATDNSYRWLVGEDSTAFGGAIRDMWNPSCFGDPGKVSDPLYACDVNNVDEGGVHSNSGIINHGFALLVDGGSYNGQTINSIGLTKATHIYWRAMTTYQTPISGYSDHAAALQASCEDFKIAGTNLSALSTDLENLSSGQIVGANDCAQIDAVVLAIELNQQPEQCSFETLLAQDPPALCGPGEAADTVLIESFDDGLNGWSTGSRDIVNPSTYGVQPWVVVGDLPFGRSGQAAFGEDPITGNCTSDIEAGVQFLESPTFIVPTNGKLVFEHSVSTEVGYDGANVKASVNSGPFVLVDSGAYVYNPYNAVLNASGNPLAGEEAFSGSDGGSFQSQFGESHVDLTSIASPGDTVVLRFEMGTDECNGVVGWYVDKVHVYSCQEGGADGDMDGDGKSDILWRNSATGQNWLYLMDGPSISSGSVINSVPTSWSIAGNGDYNGDGKADILWRNSVTGQNWMYLMDGSTILSSMSVNTVAGSSWQVAGNGDYNGDGKSDILWRNSSSGQNWMYLMDGATIVSSVNVNTVSTTWQVAGSGDYDGDGKSDILWRHSVAAVRTGCTGWMAQRSRAALVSITFPRSGVSPVMATTTATASPTFCGVTVAAARSGCT